MQKILQSAIEIPAIVKFVGKMSTLVGVHRIQHQLSRNFQLIPQNNLHPKRRRKIKQKFYNEWKSILYRNGPFDFWMIHTTLSSSNKNKMNDSNVKINTVIFKEDNNWKIHRLTMHLMRKKTFSYLAAISPPKYFFLVNVSLALQQISFWRSYMYLSLFSSFIKWTNSPASIVCWFCIIKIISITQAFSCAKSDTYLTITYLC